MGAAVSERPPRSCSVCGHEFGSNTADGRAISGPYRCGTCKGEVCLDCHMFDASGRRACATCYRSGRAKLLPDLSREEARSVLITSMRVAIISKKAELADLVERLADLEKP